MLEFFVIFISSVPSLLDQNLMMGVGQIVLSENFFYLNHLSNIPLPSISPMIPPNYAFLSTTKPNQFSDSLIKPVLYGIMIYLGTIFIPKLTYNNSSQNDAETEGAQNSSNNVQNENIRDQNYQKNSCLISLQQKEIELFTPKYCQNKEIKSLNKWENYTDTSSFETENINLIPNFHKNTEFYQGESITSMKGKVNYEYKKQMLKNYSIFGEDNWY